MQQIADRVHVHVTTVSRAVDDKWVQTPRGIFALKRFFGGGTTTTDGEEVAWDTIKQKLLEIIAKEDKSNPLSDEEIVDELEPPRLPRRPPHRDQVPPHPAHSLEPAAEAVLTTERHDMPSPFPGMNPYIEQDDVWHDFHNRFLPAAAEVIGSQVRHEFIVRIDEHVYVHEIQGAPRQSLGRADVGVASAQLRPNATGAMGLVEAPAWIRQSRAPGRDRPAALRGTDAVRREASMYLFGDG